MPARPLRPCAAPGCSILVLRGRCEAHRKADRIAQDATRGSAAARGYGRRWQAASKAFLRDHPLCQCPECGEGRKLITPSEVTDHVIPHRGDMVLFWDPLNWMAMSKPHHDRKTWRETIGGDNERAFQELRMPSDLAPSRIPITIVCGPPNSGKHPYVREHASPNDVVIELDKIMHDLSGLPAWESGAAWLDRALAERNRQLRALATDTQHERAWFVINAPDPRERALWARRLGATVEILAPPLAECVRRINAEPYRLGYTERMLEAATDWWERNNSL